MIKLWTIQPIEWYYKLKELGVLFGEKQYVEDFLLDGYDWLISEMDKRIGGKPHADCYPIWGWYQYESDRKPRPDQRCSGHITKGTHAVRIEIIKDEKEVLLSEYILWHFPLSKHYISDSEQDDIDFDKLLEQNGFSYSNPDFESLPDNLKQQIFKSWNKVLDMEYESEYQTYKRNEKKIQATFWSINVNEIVKVTEFISR